jgi:hypothetical protein
MKISAASKFARRTNVQDRLLDFLNSHPDEVYTYRDESIVKALGLKESTLSFALWALVEKGLADKEDVNGKTLIGSREAVARLRREVRREESDALDEAWANLRRIRARVGNIDTLALLDEVRGGPEPYA